MSTPITLMFTDVVGSSAAKRAASLGADISSRDRAYLAGIQSKHLRLVRDAVAEYRGKEIMTIGDAFFLTFDDTSDALHCAAAIQQRLRSQPIDTPAGPLRLRIGVHIGTPAFFENSWHGTDVDTAARAESAGSAGQIVVTDPVRNAIGNTNQIRFRPLGTFALKGIGNVPLWDADCDQHGLRRAFMRSNEQKRRARIFATVAGLAISGAAVGWYITHPPVRPPHPNVSVLISDFKNRASDPVFDGTLEPAIGVALEDASFINNFNRNDAKKIAMELGAENGQLDEQTARLVANREGLGYVVSGTIERQGSGYKVTTHTIDASTGKQIESTSVQEDTKDAVLKSVPRIAAKVRGALGDTTPESAQLSAAETFTTTSLEAAKYYAQAQDLQWAGKYDDATVAYKQALAIDPQMGRAYSGLAVIAYNSGNKNAAAKYFDQAMANIGRMSERERYRTRGLYYLKQRDAPKAIEEYTQLVKKYPADSAGYANLAFAYFYTRDMERALEVGMQAVALSPRNVPQRNNVGLYAMYAGDFKRAITEQNAVLAINPRFNLAYVGKALSQLGADDDAGAILTWQTLAKINAHGASSAAEGLADLALYQGRIQDAVDMLGNAAEDDVKSNDPDDAAIKLATLAYAESYRGNSAAAVSAATRSLTLSHEDNIQVMAAETYVAAGQPNKAQSIATYLAGKLGRDSRSYARLIDGQILLQAGKPIPAIAEMQEAQKIADTWLGHFYLGRAYLAINAYAEADSEFDACLRRRGEATAVFLDENPTYHLLPLIYYYDGLARAGLNSPAAKQSFQTFVLLRARQQGDPLVADALRRR